jgi:hypothetical protein
MGDLVNYLLNSQPEVDCVNIHATLY